MAQLFTIDKIEGNSNIGAPVFSRLGQMKNYEYLVLSPVKQPKINDDAVTTLVPQEIQNKFQINLHQTQKSAVTNYDADLQKQEYAVCIFNEINQKIQTLNGQHKQVQHSGTKEIRPKTKSTFGVTREQYYKVKQPYQKVPPVGAYRSVYTSIDKYLPTKCYGTSSVWDGKLAQQSIEIKQKDFNNKTQLCNRLDKSLVNLRFHQVAAFKKMIFRKRLGNTFEKMIETKSGGLSSHKFLKKSKSNNETQDEKMFHINANTSKCLFKRYESDQDLKKNHEKQGDEKREFSFENDRLNRTNFSLVSGPMFQQLISDNPDEAKYPKHFNQRVGDFSKQLTRPPIKSHPDPHVARFNNDDSFDKSKFLTKAPTISQLVIFEKQQGRRDDVIYKGGDVQADYKSRTNTVYNVSNKAKFSLKDLDKGIPDLSKLCARERPNQLRGNATTAERIDNLKVAQVHRKLVSKNQGCYVDMKKQKKRDFTQILRVTDAYANIQRENQRADYIKSILDSVED